MMRFGKFSLMKIITWLMQKIVREVSVINNLKRRNSLTKDFDIHVIYRISDEGYPKEKPKYINNHNCIKNALRRFPPSYVDWTIICDNCSEKTMEDILLLCEQAGVEKDSINNVHIGNGAGTFRIAYEIALQFPEEDVVYFLENDYLHREGSFEALKIAFSTLQPIDYLTLYDHPDKYEFNFPYSVLYNKTQVYFDGTEHWQRIFATTMTFAARIRTLNRDKKIFWRWTETKHPYDLYIFMNLHNRVIVSPIPTFSTHGETQYLSPCIDWENECNNTIGENENESVEHTY